MFGVLVSSKNKNIEELVDVYDIHHVTIAIPSLSAKNLERIVSYGNVSHIKNRQMPSVEDIVQCTYKNNDDLVSVIANIQDRICIFKVIEQYKPDPVCYTAAQKHVHLMEYKPIEAFKDYLYG